MRLLACAERLDYAVNLKARGLRLSRSSLAGMILPHYRNRFSPIGRGVRSRSETSRPVPDRGQHAPQSRQ
jgi:DNA-binding LacI/PurR family transcriptional regulator